jgi:hypothetical protein
MKVKLVSDSGETLVTEPLLPTTFSTGSKGFKANFKVVDDSGKRYQVGVNVVEIGSKPK